ncbi:hypothetical protein MHU86_16309 [Fragilaria crotonensis]|nr:hypothetical protein MHU86_16309 [Fragilaria crotonensis]
MAWARNSLLDCPAFLAAVSSTGQGRLTSQHLSAFYEALHHLEYPPMNQFAQMYSASTLEAVAKIRLKNRIPLEVLEFVQNPLNQFDTLTTKLCGVKSSVDKKVFRLYIEVDGGRIVETLATTYDYAAKRYADISVSAQFTSQIGTSSNYNLKPFEIIAQLVHASHVVTSVYESPITIRRVYFQECGEPLLNYDNVVTACLLMSDRRTWNINAGRITISTFGVTPRIFELTRDLPDVMVSVDLVAPTQALRHSLVPWAQRYSLDGLMEAIGHHTEAKSLDTKLSLTRRDKVVIQYTMIDNETKRLRHARELGKLCKYRRLPVILVPYQRRSVDDRGRCPSMKHIHKFMAVVKSYGVSCAVKVPPGASVVDAAKKFVVRAEGSSARGSIDLRYVDNSKTQIDFWTTLASVRSEYVSDTGLNKSKRIGDSRSKPNGVASTDVRATSRKPDNSSACHDVPLKSDPLIQDPFDPPVVGLPKLAPQTDEDSSSLTDPDLDFDYASDDILYQDGEAFECAPRPVELGLPNYGQRNCTNVERYSRVGYSCRRREDHAYVERESTGENKKYDSDLEYHIDVTSDKHWGDASEELLLSNTSAPYAEAKPLKITVACGSEGTRSPGSATDPAENMEWENDHAINQPAIILNDNETVVWLPHENQMPTALGVPLTSPRSTLNGSDLCLADDSERSFSSLWEVVTNSRRNDDDHPCHLLGSISSVPSASIVSVVSKFDVLYGFSPAPLRHGLKGNEKGSVYLD